MGHIKPYQRSQIFEIGQVPCHNDNGNGSFPGSPLPSTTPRAFRETAATASPAGSCQHAEPVAEQLDASSTESHPDSSLAVTVDIA